VSAVIPLGRIESVDLRKAWPDEAKNFTPWLAEEENLTLLGDMLGLRLELEAVEKQVGPFSADILAKDIVSGKWVLIENQIEGTDHRHLGQILTYAAGLDAPIVIWVAKNFREEHRAAVDYLNRISDEDHLFFGLQVELLKIGESAYAPSFSIVAKPNDWSKQSAAAKFAVDDVLSPTQALYREFWGALIQKAAGIYPALAARTPYKGNWQTGERIGSGSGFSVDANASFASGSRLRVEAYISGASAPLAFEQLCERKSEIEHLMGQELSWEPLQGHEKRIALYMPGTQNKEDKGQWDAQHKWLLEYWPKITEIFRPMIAQIHIGEPEGGD
jgi:hypothetical protein